MAHSTATHPAGPRPLSHSARCRVLAGHTIRSLSAASGVSARQIVNLEAGKCRPRLDTALAIAYALGEDDPRVIYPDLGHNGHERPTDARGGKVGNGSARPAS
jgi:transcriptional regulator with XRE-family HTH domain